MPVDFRHPEFVRHEPKWRLVDDICDGENLQNYIVPVGMDSDSPPLLDLDSRNEQIYRRSVFYGVAGYTVRGLVGLVFHRWPTLSVPGPIQRLADDIDGEGVSIYQQSQQVIREQLRKGRCGLLVDLLSPVGASARDGSRAAIALYKAEDIINWRFERVGSETKLTLVVLSYREEVPQSDGYGIEYEDRLLELRLTEGKYTTRRWKKAGGDWTLISEVMPYDATGNPLSEIPFLFVGSENNTPSIDHAPMLDICKVNIGHFNNSAEYEDSVFTVGQAQPWISGGMNAEDAPKRVGSSSLILVPEGGQFGFAQPKPNTLAREAMHDKVEMMVGLGAMFIQPGSAVKTATQAEGDQRVQHSVLSLIASNCSEAYSQSLAWVAQFMGADGDVEYAVAQEFADPKNANMFQHIVSAFMTGALPVDDYMRWLQRYGLVDSEKSLSQFSGEVSDGTLFNESFE